MLKELVLSLPLDSLWDLDHSTYCTLPLSYVHPYQQQQCKVNSFNCLLRLFDPPPPPFFFIGLCQHTLLSVWLLFFFFTVPSLQPCSPDRQLLHSQTSAPSFGFSDSYSSMILIFNDQSEWERRRPSTSLGSFTQTIHRKRTDSESIEPQPEDHQRQIWTHPSSTWSHHLSSCSNLFTQRIIPTLLETFTQPSSYLLPPPLHSHPHLHLRPTPPPTSIWLHPLLSSQLLLPLPLLLPPPPPPLKPILYSISLLVWLLI